MALRFIRLTRPNVRTLKPGERITEHGITAEGLKNNDVRYSINIRLMVNGCTALSVARAMRLRAPRRKV